MHRKISSAIHKNKGTAENVKTSWRLLERPRSTLA
jgi:hypothetical protein